MRLIDLHADTMLEMYLKNTSNMQENMFQIDIEKMRKAKSFVQCLAIYNDFVNDENMYEKIIGFYNFYIKTISMYPDELAIIKKSDDIDKNYEDGKISILISIEDSGPVEGDLERIKDLYNRNIRMMSLTWNYENCFGYPNSENPQIMNKGLKKFGVEAIELMDELGIIIDISHLSDGGAYDVFKHSRNPIVATHSNARTIVNNTRNMTDDMIRKLSETGGIIGLNFCGEFLGDDEVSNVKNMVRHIKHIIRTGGIESIAIGTDFDGDIDDGNMEIQNIGEIEKLEIGLRKEGFTYDEIEKIFYKNALRVFKEIL